MNIERREGYFAIELPRGRSYFMAFFFVAVCAITGSAVVGAVRETRPLAAAAILAATLGAVLLAGVSVGFRERFIVTNQALTLEQTIFGLGRRRTFPLSTVTNVHWRLESHATKGGGVVNYGCAVFDVPGRTIAARTHLSFPAANRWMEVLNGAIEDHRREHAKTYRT